MALLGGSVMAGIAAPASAAEPVADDRPAVEDFTYPVKEAVPGITLSRGNGRILLADCVDGGAGLVRVRSSVRDEEFCFDVRGPGGYLALELRKSYQLRGDGEHRVEAEVLVNGVPKDDPVAVPVNTWTTLPVEAGEEGNTLVELRSLGVATGGLSTASYPFVARVQVGDPAKDGRGCSGALVDPSWVVTTKDCFTANGEQVHGGRPATATSVTVDGSTVTVIDVVPHPDRSVVLAKLAAPVTGVLPVRIGTSAPAVGDQLIVVGAGRTASAWIPDSAHAAAFAVTGRDASTVTVSARDTEQVGPCQGDAGGPGLVGGPEQPTMVALTARAGLGGCFGAPAQAGRGGIQTRVDDLADWFEQQIGRPSRPTSFVSGNQQHIFARGADGRLHHWKWVSGEGRGYESWGGDLAGNPAAFVFGEQQHVLGRSSDGKLTHWVWEPGKGVRRETWEGAISGDPTGYATADAQHVYARGADGKVHHWSWTRGTGFAHDIIGDGISGDPTSFVWGTQHHVWARGTDGKLTHWVWEPGKQNRRETWDGGITGDPIGFLYGDQQHIFSRGADGQLQELQHWTWTGGTGRGYENWGGSLAGDPAGFATTDAQHVYARGTDAKLHHWSWVRGAGRSHEVIGDGITGDPTGYVLGTAHHVWARGTDGKLTHWVWEPGKSPRRETWDGATL